MDEEDLIQQMLDRLRYAGAVDEPGYLGGARTTYNPFAGLGAATANVNAPSSYAQRALDIQAEMAAARNASLGGSPMYVGGSSPTEVSVTARPRTQAYVYGPEESSARVGDWRNYQRTDLQAGPATRTATSIDNPAVRTAIMDARLEGENISLDEAEKRAGVVRTKNVEEIAAASETPEDVERRLAKEKTQALSTRKGTGLVKALAPFAKVATPLSAAIALATAPDEALASTTGIAKTIAGGVTGLNIDKFISDYKDTLQDVEDVKQKSLSDWDAAKALARTPTWDTGAVSNVGSTMNASYGDPVLSGELGTGAVPYDRWGAVTPEEGEVHDVHRHMGLTMGIWPEEGDPTNLKQQFTNTVTQLPSVFRKWARDRSDTIEQFLDDETNTDKLQDLINNQIAEDTDISFTNQGLTQLEKYHQAVDNPNVVYDKDSLNAMVALAKDDYYKSEEQVQEAINEIKSGVDTFTAGPTEAQKSAQRQAYDQNVVVQAAPAQPTGPSAADIQRDKQAAVDARMAQQAAARLQQQQQMDAQIARQAEQARQAQVAQAQADAQAQAALARQVYSDLMAGRDRGEPSSREIQRAMERATQVDTFAGYEGGPMSAAEINVAGGMEFGGAGGMAGSDRGGGGRGGWGPDR